jgi:hypothetical protein
MTLSGVILGFIVFLGYFSMLYPPLATIWDDIRDKKRKK